MQRLAQSIRGIALGVVTVGVSAVCARFVAELTATNAYAQSAPRSNDSGVPAHDAHGHEAHSSTSISLESDHHSVDAAVRGDAGVDLSSFECPDDLAPADREGHCCPTGQRWRAGRCEGAITQCMPGFVTSSGARAAGGGDAGTPAASNNGCAPRACDPSMQRAGDGIHCCFTGQTWSTREKRCTGAEQCPEGTERVGRGECVPHVRTNAVRASGPNRPTMRFVPGGAFEMGARGSGRIVSLGAYWIDRTEVSAGEYANCVRAGFCQAISDPYGANGGSDGRFAAVNVTHAMARAYCAWKQGRLPTEAEWEFAARGSDSRMFPWGERAPDCTLARMQGCGPGSTMVGVHTAGQSPFGVIDLSGNVAEWVMDRAGGSIAAGFERDPVGPNEGARRIIRGGSFADSANNLRAIARRELNPQEARPDVGFRCVSTASE